MEADLAIRVRGVVRCFGTNRALDGVSFEVRRGEIFGLLGPNGAGKTTTLRVLTGQIAPQAGEALVAGCDVVRDRTLLQRRIGVVFEEQLLYERLSARMNLEFACGLYGVDPSRVDEVLELVGLRDRAKDKVSSFSSGMRQRLMIARALIHRPEVLFLDEPSRGLDPAAAAVVHAAVLELKRSGTTILLTTHYMEEAEKLCDRLGFMVRGRVVAVGTPLELRLRHAQPRMRVLLDEDLKERVLDLEDPGQVGQLMSWIAGGRVRSAHTMEDSLADVFLRVAGAKLE